MCCFILTKKGLQCGLNGRKYCKHKKKNTGKVLPPITFSNLIQRNTSVEGTGYLHE